MSTPTPNTKDADTIKTMQLSIDRLQEKLDEKSHFATDLALIVEEIVTTTGCVPSMPDALEQMWDEHWEADGGVFPGHIPHRVVARVDAFRKALADAALTDPRFPLRVWQEFRAAYDSGRIAEAHDIIIRALCERNT